MKCFFSPSISNMPAVDLFIGAGLNCVEAVTLGMPFEVWKTRMGSNRTENTIQAFRSVYAQGGLAGFWVGTLPKIVESSSKGMILMYAKEGINDFLLERCINPTAAAIIAGAGGGIAQTGIIGPCTYMVTGAVTEPGISMYQRIIRTYNRAGIAGFYKGGTAVAFRQATNWASRQGFTEAIRRRAKVHYHNSEDASLSKAQEIGCGIFGGTAACWNHPFEVARIEAQKRGNAGKPVGSMLNIIGHIMKNDGFKGLFRGIVPRIGLGIWQTLFMVTGAKIVKDELKKCT